MSPGVTLPEEGGALHGWAQATLQMIQLPRTQDRLQVGVWPIF